VGEKRSYSVDNPTVNLGAIYGIIKNSNQTVIVSNRIFEIRICNYFISKDEEDFRKKDKACGAGWITVNGKRIFDVMV